MTLARVERERERERGGEERYESKRRRAEGRGSKSGGRVGSSSQRLCMLLIRVIR